MELKHYTKNNSHFFIYSFTSENLFRNINHKKFEEILNNCDGEGATKNLIRCIKEYEGYRKIKDKEAAASIIISTKFTCSPNGITYTIQTSQDLHFFNDALPITIEDYFSGAVDFAYSF